jgi:type II secretory pathway pseudopilin PulG
MRNSFSKKSLGFTIIELVIIISVIGILASIVVINYSGWRQRASFAQLQSDLGNLAALMEGKRNFSSSGYPTTLPSDFTKSSPDIVLSLSSIDGGKTYCVEGYNTQYSATYYHAESGRRGAQLGRCSTVNISVAGGGGGAGGLYPGGNGTAGETTSITIGSVAHFAYGGGGGYGVDWSGIGATGSPGSTAINGIGTLTSTPGGAANGAPLACDDPSTCGGAGGGGGLISGSIIFPPGFTIKAIVGAGGWGGTGAPGYEGGDGNPGGVVVTYASSLNLNVTVTNGTKIVGNPNTTVTFNSSATASNPGYITRN